MGQLSIRQATPPDADAIHLLMRGAFLPFKDQYTPGCFDATILDPERIRQRMEEGIIWIAKTDRILGVLGAVSGERGLYCRGLAVAPEARGMGAAKALFAEAEKYARQRGASCLWLSTTPFLVASIGLYRRLGFVDAAGPPDLHGTPLRSFEKQL